MEKKGRFLRILKNLALTILFLGMAGLLGWYYYTSDGKIKQLEKDKKVLESELSKVKLGLKDEVIHTLAFQDSFYLSLMMEPLSWAIRNELLTTNYQKIDQYLAQFVKEPKVKLVMVVDEKGDIVASSDMKARKQAFADFYPQTDLKKEQIEIKMNRSSIQIVKPVMGFDKRLGTIFVVYEPGDVKIMPGSLSILK